MTLSIEVEAIRSRLGSIVRKLALPVISQAKRIRHNKTSVIGLFSLLVGVLLLVANIGLSVVYPKRKVHVLFPPTAQSIFVSGAKKGGVTSSPRIKGPWPLISHHVTILLILLLMPLLVLRKYLTVVFMSECPSKS